MKNDLAVQVCVRARRSVSLLYDDGSAPEDQPVIVLADLANGHQGFQVLVRLVGVYVVQGAAVPGIPVGSREVYGHLRHTHIYPQMSGCDHRREYSNKQEKNKLK